jgi:hypothetical protein
VGTGSEDNTCRSCLPRDRFSVHTNNTTHGKAADESKHSRNYPTFTRSIHESTTNATFTKTKQNTFTKTEPLHADTGVPLIKYIVIKAYYNIKPRPECSAVDDELPLCNSGEAPAVTAYQTRAFEETKMKGNTQHKQTPVLTLVVFVSAVKHKQACSNRTFIMMPFEVSFSSVDKTKKHYK